MDTHACFVPATELLVQLRMPRWWLGNRPLFAQPTTKWLLVLWAALALGRVEQPTLEELKYTLARRGVDASSVSRDFLELRVNRTRKMSDIRAYLERFWTGTTTQLQRFVQVRGGSCKRAWVDCSDRTSAQITAWALAHLPPGYQPGFKCSNARSLFLRQGQERRRSGSSLNKIS